MSTPRTNNGNRRNFASISTDDIPNGRKGKHHAMLMKVLEDLEHLVEGRAMKVPIADFTGSAADIRSAINRATAKLNIKIETSSDDEFLYVWRRETPAEDL